MGYAWPGMKILSWEEVKELHANGELVGCFYLHDDDTEAQIEEDYSLEDIVAHYENGGEFGYEL